ncbi:MAG TPA: hypothetical protein VFR23_24590 [Jiangellaceae bacterium]|nr:hypothetical protein [Jiangellaceae bacterium]
MKTIHYVRHQAAGILTDFPFESAPSQAQMAALQKLCFQRHGAKHPKTAEPYWLKAVEVKVLGAGDVPTVPDRSLSVANEAAVPKVEVTAVGHVENPK